MECPNKIQLREYVWEKLMGTDNEFAIADHINGCPKCLRIAQEEDKLKDFWESYGGEFYEFSYQMYKKASWSKEFVEVLKRLNQRSSCDLFVIKRFLKSLLMLRGDGFVGPIIQVSVDKDSPKIKSFSNRTAISVTNTSFQGSIGTLNGDIYIDRKISICVRLNPENILIRFWTGVILPPSLVLITEDGKAVVGKAEINEESSYSISFKNITPGKYFLVFEPEHIDLEVPKKIERLPKKIERLQMIKRTCKIGLIAAILTLFAISIPIIFQFSSTKDDAAPLVLIDKSNTSIANFIINFQSSENACGSSNYLDIKTAPQCSDAIIWPLFLRGDKSNTTLNIKLKRLANFWVANYWEPETVPKYIDSDKIWILSSNGIVKINRQSIKVSKSIQIKLLSDHGIIYRTISTKFHDGDVFAWSMFDVDNESTRTVNFEQGERSWLCSASLNSEQGITAKAADWDQCYKILTVSMDCTSIYAHAICVDNIVAINKESNIILNVDNKLTLNSSQGIIIEEAPVNYLEQSLKTVPEYIASKIWDIASIGIEDLFQPKKLQSIKPTYSEDIAKSHSIYAPVAITPCSAIIEQSPKTVSVELTSCGKVVQGSVIPKTEKTLNLATSSTKTLEVCADKNKLACDNLDYTKFTTEACEMVKTSRETASINVNKMACRETLKKEKDEAEKKECVKTLEKEKDDAELKKKKEKDKLEPQSVDQEPSVGGSDSHFQVKINYGMLT